jgi:hypothetical protein
MKMEVAREQIGAGRDEDKLWLRRIRMGNPGQHLTFHHAFAEWWDKYRHSHPEFFTLNGKGRREPLFPNRPDRIKMQITFPFANERENCLDGVESWE